MNSILEKLDSASVERVGPAMPHRLAILIPTYNRASIIHALIENIAQEVAQSGENVQVVISDNCSIDGTTGVLHRYSQQFSWLKVIRTPRHLHSAEENVAFAISHCDADYIWSLGDDDYMTPGAINKVMAIVETDRYDLFLFNNGIYYADSEVSKEAYIPMVGQVYECTIDQLIMRLGFTTIAAALSSALFRADKFTGELLQEYVEITPYLCPCRRLFAGLQALGAALSAAPRSRPFGRPERPDRVSPRCRSRPECASGSPGASA